MEKLPKYTARSEQMIIRYVKTFNASIDSEKIKKNWASVIGRSGKYGFIISL